MEVVFGRPRCIVLLQIVIQTVDQHVGASRLHLLGPELVVPGFVEQVGDGRFVGMSLELLTARHQQKGTLVAVLPEFLGQVEASPFFLELVAHKDEVEHGNARNLLVQLGAGMRHRDLQIGTLELEHPHHGPHEQLIIIDNQNSVRNYLLSIEKGRPNSTN